jgi:hypothetical protein
MSELEKKQETPPPATGQADDQPRPNSSEPPHDGRARTGFSPDLPMSSPD